MQGCRSQTTKTSRVKLKLPKTKHLSKNMCLVQKVNAFPNYTVSIVPFWFHSFNFSKMGQVCCFLPLWNTSHRMKKGKKWFSDTVSSGYVTVYQWWGWGDGEVDMLHVIICRCLFLNVNKFSSNTFFSFERHEQQVNRLYGFAKLECKVIGKSSTGKGHPRKFHSSRRLWQERKNEILITAANYIED